MFFFGGGPGPDQESTMTRITIPQESICRWVFTSNSNFLDHSTAKKNTTGFSSSDWQRSWYFHLMWKHRSFWQLTRAGGREDQICSGQGVKHPDLHWCLGMPWPSFSLEVLDAPKMGGNSGPEKLKKDCLVMQEMYWNVLKCEILGGFKGHCQCDRSSRDWSPVMKVQFAKKKDPRGVSAGKTKDPRCSLQSFRGEVVGRKSQHGSAFTDFQSCRLIPEGTS